MDPRHSILLLFVFALLASPALAATEEPEVAFTELRKKGKNAKKDEANRDQADAAAEPEPPKWKSTKALAYSSFAFQWFNYQECPASQLRLLKPTSQVRLVALDVLNSGLRALATRKKQDGDSRTLAYICTLAVAFTDAYRAMRQATQSLLAEPDETGVSTPVGVWFAATLRKEAGDGKKSKREKEFYNKCAFIASRVNEMLVASDFRAPAGETVSPPAALGNYMNASLDEFADNSEKQLAHIVGGCLREKDAFRRDAWAVTHHALLQTWTSLDFMAACAFREASLSQKEKLALLMARQTMLEHSATGNFFAFLEAAQRFGPLAEKLGYFASGKDSKKVAVCLPEGAGSDTWNPHGEDVMHSFVTDLSSAFQ
ncbi:hypothetical protein BESB_052130 [Besnoitia besnoiti]|uniref:Transmembrane protein n=1 Tax=Besnoitia besnoiti TaxID=94643 RepID=A0A2A9MJK0_BESBE|nr:hypothetical protein BESB_052130 [Besnoitia besnoiti]PFH35562.1 hypothetical protein BESB_052130 [Besnoitia besnoiti]